jgi:hypothetical protein
MKSLYIHIHDPLAIYYRGVRHNSPPEHFINIILLLFARQPLYASQLSELSGLFL